MRAAFTLWEASEACYWKRRNAAGMLPNPQCGLLSLARNPGSLARFMSHWCPRRELHSHCPILKAAPLLLGYAGIELKCSRSGSHRHWAEFKSAASALGYGSETVPAAGLAPALDEV